MGQNVVVCVLWRFRCRDETAWFQLRSLRTFLAIFCIHFKEIAHMAYRPPKAQEYIISFAHCRTRTTFHQMLNLFLGTASPRRQMGVCLFWVIINHHSPSKYLVRK